MKEKKCFGDNWWEKGGLWFGQQTCNRVDLLTGRLWGRDCPCGKTHTGVFWSDE